MIMDKQRIKWFNELKKKVLYLDNINSQYNTDDDISSKKKAKIEAEIAKTHKEITRMEKSKPHTKYIPYPQIGDPNFMNILFRKKEFNNSIIHDKTSVKFDDEMRKRCNSNQFKLSNNQIFLKNFISTVTPYNSILLYHGVGVGKSCAAISIAEQFLDAYYTKALILMPSNLQENFKKQIYNANATAQCTGDKYRKLIGDDNSAKNQSKIIAERYDIYGFYEFANIVQSYTDSQIEKYFSRRVIIIDEVHNIRNYNESKKSSAAIKRVLKVSKNTKLILLSATPMYNSADEIIDILNYLFINDNKPLIVKKNFFEDDKIIGEKELMQLGELSRGYISFLRGENPITFPAKFYGSINDKPTTSIQFCNSYFTKEHEKVYNLVSKSTDITDNSFGANLVQLSNICFKQSNKESHLIGEPGLLAAFNVNNGVFSYKDDDDFLRYNKIESHSPKIKTIIDILMKNQEESGIIFIYSYFIYSGILPLAFALEHMGYGRYNSANLLAGTSASSKYKYVILQPGYAPSYQQYIDIVKSKENVDGKLIKIVLGSSVAAEGLDFKNIRQVHILEPWYNMNKLQQVIGRAVRNCSHTDLPFEKRNVLVYHHVCNLKNHKNKSIDNLRYDLSLSKQDNISKVENVLHFNSIDCVINKHSASSTKILEKSNFDMILSNGSKLSHKFSKQNTDKCVPFNINDDPIDTSTYRPIFFIDEIKQCSVDISTFIQAADSVSFSFDEIVNELKIYEIDVIIYALNDMIENKMLIGNNGYLIERSNRYIYQPKNASETIPLNYRKHFIQNRDLVIQMNDKQKANNISGISNMIAEKIAEINGKLEPGTINSFLNKNVDDKKIDYIVDRLVFDDLCYYLENILENINDGENKRYIKSFISGHLLIPVNINTFLIRDVVNTQLSNDPYDYYVYIIGSNNPISKVTYYDDQYTNAIDDYVKNITKKINKLDDQLNYNYMQHMKKIVHLKIKNKPSINAGFVLSQTSTHITAAILADIVKLDENIGNKIIEHNKNVKKLNRAQLCFIFELYSRCIPNFLRVCEAKALGLK